jgi:hypothetical protein
MRVIWPEGYHAAKEVRYDIVIIQSHPSTCHTRVDVGAVLAHKIENFTTRGRKPVGRGGGIIPKGFSCIGLQGQA